MQSQRIGGLTEHFAALSDPRVERTREHELIDIVVIGLCCVLCGGESFNDMAQFGQAKLDWFKTFLKLPNGIPSHDTFNRLFCALDPQNFLERFLAWTQSVRAAIPQEIVALDGKALRRAIDAGDAPRYVVSAWAEDNGLVLGQWEVAEKTNEITAIPRILRALELSGCIVTLDAMGCQKNIAREIKEADAEYVLALKGNQGTAHQEVKAFLDQTVAEKKRPRPAGAPQPKAAATLQELETIDKDHGRIETRRYSVSAELAWFADRADWEGLRTVGMVEATRESNGQKSVERRYYLSSLPPDVKSFARAVRGHWGIENKLHWVMDVVFGEDQSRARSGHAAHNLATLRRLALNLLKREKKKRSLRGKQLDAGWDNAYLLKVLGSHPSAI
jgi:predicted transposase YbfD/YdcC